MMRLAKLTAAVLLIAFTATGCLPLPGLDPAGVPGKVTFDTTGLGVESTVTVNMQRRRTSATGDFTVRLDGAGVYRWEVESLLGRHAGTTAYSGSGRITIQLPAFPGWDAVLFDHLLVYETGGTVRWKKGTVSVWIESSPHRARAQAALNEWAQVLSGGLSFSEASSRDRADLVIEYPEQAFARMANGQQVPVDGVCERTSVGDRIVRGVIHITERYGNSMGLHRHEIGHCIGLGHSPVQGHLMYKDVPANRTITSVEANMARLLYSIDRSGPLTRGAGLLGEQPHADYAVFYMPDGTVVEVFPSFLVRDETGD